MVSCTRVQGSGAQQHAHRRVRLRAVPASDGQCRPAEGHHPCLPECDGGVQLASGELCSYLHSEGPSLKAPAALAATRCVQDNSTQGKRAERCVTATQQVSDDTEKSCFLQCRPTYRMPFTAGDTSPQSLAFTSQAGVGARLLHPTSDAAVMKGCVGSVCGHQVGLDKTHPRPYHCPCAPRGKRPVGTQASMLAAMQCLARVVVMTLR